MPELAPASSCIVHHDANHIACIGIPNAAAILALFASLQHRCCQHIAGTSRKSKPYVYSPEEDTRWAWNVRSIAHTYVFELWKSFGQLLCVGLVASDTFTRRCKGSDAAFRCTDGCTELHLASRCKDSRWHRVALASKMLHHVSPGE